MANKFQLVKPAIAWLYEMDKFLDTLNPLETDSHEERLEKAKVSTKWAMDRLESMTEEEHVALVNAFAYLRGDCEDLGALVLGQAARIKAKRNSEEARRN